MQELTTRQLEILILFDEIERLTEADIVETGIKEILTQDQFMSIEEFDEVFKVLRYYGYIDYDGGMTIDGKQYIALFLDFLQKKENEPNIVINNSFTLITLENINIGLNAFFNLETILDVGECVSSVTKKVMQSIKNIIQK